MQKMTHNRDNIKVANFSHNMINIYKNPARYRKLIERAVFLLKQVMNSKGITDLNQLAKFRHSLDVRKIERTLVNEFQIDKGDLDFISNDIWAIVADKKSIDDVLGAEKEKVAENPSSDEKKGTTEASSEQVEQIDGEAVKHILRSIDRIPSALEGGKNKEKIVQLFDEKLKELKKKLKRYADRVERDKNVRYIFASKRIVALYDENEEFNYENIRKFVKIIDNILFTEGINKDNVSKLDKAFSELEFYLKEMKNDLDYEYTAPKTETVGDVKRMLNDIEKIFIKDENAGRKELEKMINGMGIDTKTFKKQLDKNRISLPNDLMSFID